MKHTIHKYPLLTFFIFANVFSWLLWLPLLIDVLRTNNTDSPLWWLHYVGGFGPMLAAFTMTAVLYGSAGVRTLLKRQAGFGVSMKWLLVAIFLPFIFFVIAALIEGITKGIWIDISLLTHTNKLPGFSFMSFVVIEIIAFGFGEETGWRGFALPRLQDKYNPLLAAAILTLPWAAWHVPTFFYNENMMSMGVSGTIGWLLSLLTGSFILSWLFNNSKGSILPVALFHGLLDVVFVSQAVAGKSENYIGAMITVFAVALTFVVWKSKNKVMTNQVTRLG